MALRCSPTPHRFVWQVKNLKTSPIGHFSLVWSSLGLGLPSWFFAELMSTPALWAKFSFPRPMERLHFQKFPLTIPWPNIQSSLICTKVTSLFLLQKIMLKKNTIGFMEIHLTVQLEGMYSRRQRLLFLNPAISKSFQ